MKEKLRALSFEQKTRSWRLSAESLVAVQECDATGDDKRDADGFIKNKIKIITNIKIPLQGIGA